MPTDNERIDTLIGEVLALQSALKAVIALHPDKGALAATLETETQKGLARLESSFAPDHAVRAFQRVVAILQLELD